MFLDADLERDAERYVQLNAAKPIKSKVHFEADQDFTEELLNSYLNDNIPGDEEFKYDLNPENVTEPLPLSDDLICFFCHCVVDDPI